jgi:hypothetical protein
MAMEGRRSGGRKRAPNKIHFGHASGRSFLCDAQFISLWGAVWGDVAGDSLKEIMERWAI